MYDLIQMLNHLLLDFITFINEKSKELCAYVIILHVLKIDRVHGYWFCKRLLVLIETAIIVFNDKLHSCQYERNRWDWQIYQDVHTRRQNKSKHVQRIESSKCYTNTNY